VTIYAYGSSVPVWWAGIESKVARLKPLEVWQIVPLHSQALAALAQRSMPLQVTMQDGQVWVSDSQATAEITPVPLKRRG
jgi:uncharacterized protein YaeQ